MRARRVPSSLVGLRVSAGVSGRCGGLGGAPYAQRGAQLAQVSNVTADDSAATEDDASPTQGSPGWASRLLPGLAPHYFYSMFCLRWQRWQETPCMAGRAGSAACTPPTQSLNPSVQVLPTRCRL